MKIHEYQAQEIFRRYDVPALKGILCRSVDDVINAYRELGSKAVAVKAQVLTGGRGKAGGIAIASDEKEVISAAKRIIGMNIRGFIVDRVIVAPAVNIASEFYLSYVVDRSAKSVVMILSKEGGVDIEQVALKTPEKIYKIPVFPFVGVPDFLARKAASMLFDKYQLIDKATELIKNLYRVMIDYDASLVEINPLVSTPEGELLALDAKINFDDNAAYRQNEIVSLMEPDPQEKKELEAKAKGFSYIRLKGEIGCMVNGAGLAMTTMDLVNLYGGKAANFLDIGGSSNPEKVAQAMDLLLSDPEVKVVLVNIFGGITRCDDVAKGLVQAFNSLKSNIPVVIRLTGTNEKEGHQILEGTRFHTASSMRDAINMAIELSKLSTGK
jgi:succinyl-CoA synthetase beta subunit